MVNLLEKSQNPGKNIIFRTKCWTFMGQKRDIFGTFLSWKCPKNVPLLSQKCPPLRDKKWTFSGHFCPENVLDFGFNFNILTIFHWKKGKILEKHQISEVFFTGFWLFSNNLTIFDWKKAKIQVKHHFSFFSVKNG